MALAVLAAADSIWIGDAMRKRQALTADYEKIIFKVLDNLKEASAELIVARAVDRYAPKVRYGDAPTETPKPERIEVVSTRVEYEGDGVFRIYVNDMLMQRCTGDLVRSEVERITRDARNATERFTARPRPTPESLAPVVLVQPPIGGME